MYVASLATPPEFGPQASRHEYVAAHIRSAILNGKLRAGQRLRQAEIAADLGFSITPVREALRTLSIEGLVDSNAYNGWWVHSPTMADLKEIYAARIALCPVIVRQAIGEVTDSVLRRAETILAELDDCDDLGEWVRLNRMFHEALESPGQGQFLRKLQEQLSALSQIYMSLAVGLDDEKKAKAQHDHRLILEAFTRRDLDAATSVTVAHLQSSLTSALEALEQAPVTDTEAAASP